jgi:hypothetical protein
VSAELFGYAYLYDQTSGTYWFSPTSFSATAYSSVYDSCYAKTCSTNFTGNEHVAVSTAVLFHFRADGLNAAHVYLLEVSWSSSAYAYEYGTQSIFTVAHEAASVAAAGPGLGVTLDWITIA